MQQFPRQRSESKSIRRLATGAMAALALWFWLNTAHAGAQSPADGSGRITFIKEFPNSKPDYFAVVVESNGETLYRIAPDDDRPLQFRLSAETTQQIFSLARKLNLFREMEMESKRRVAHMGAKTLSYENGEENHQVRFNHTDVPEAAELAGLFERISQTQQHALRLEYLMRFDRLGVVKELLSLESNLDQGRLAEPALLAPLLEKVQKDKSIVNVAQGRAAQILKKIQAGK